MVENVDSRVGIMFGPHAVRCLIRITIDCPVRPFLYAINVQYIIVCVCDSFNVHLNFATLTVILLLSISAERQKNYAKIIYYKWIAMAMKMIYRKDGHLMLKHVCIRANTLQATTAI